MTFRRRLLLILLPSLLLAILAGVGVALLQRVSNRIDAILRDNYDSVVFMMALDEALERIDSSFQLALLGREDQARAQYRKYWSQYRKALLDEKGNITLPGEQELVDQLDTLTRRYRRAGNRFFAPGRSLQARRADYLEGAPEQAALLVQFTQIKDVSRDIRLLNQRNMEEANQDAQRTATVSLYGFAGALVATALLAGLLAWRTIRATLRPIQELTRSAQAIASGNLNSVVAVLTRDELGTLAEEFNSMTRQLRDYRQTHLARLLRAQRTSQATIDAFPDPVLVLDPDGRVEMANPAARQVLGIAPPAPGTGGGSGSGAVWQPPEALAGPLREALQGQRAFLTQAFDQTVTFRLSREEHAFLPQVLPIHDPYGNVLGAAVVLNDVTRFRLLDRIKSDLVATASHELKTPLTSVRLALHLLLEETVGPLTPKQTELLLDARDNAERLLNMIEHLLALARLEHGRGALRPQATAPQALLDAAAEVARPRAESKHVDLVVQDASGLPPVATDPERLGHALNNLLDNALTYTPEGGKITLSAAADGEARVVLQVADTGTGIPPDYLPHVFERFFRVPGQSQARGTGLGLAIVREIVTAHGGEITCDSRPGEGTVFRLALPVWSGAEVG
jgi:signal transduction histidine kinase/HAMP domain-containing protein